MSGAGSSGRKSLRARDETRGSRGRGLGRHGWTRVLLTSERGHSARPPPSLPSTPRHRRSWRRASTPVTIAFDQRGGLWFTSNAGGTSPTNGVWYIPPGGQPLHVVSGLAATGLAWVGNSLYVASLATPGSARITVFQGFNGSRFTSQNIRLDGLQVGQHTIGSIAQGPDGQLYVGVGATSNSGPPGSVLAFAPNGGSPVVKATGLQSAFGLAFYGRFLLVTDSGRDDLGPFRPPEKLNEFDPAGPVVNFGSPRCYGQGGPACGAPARRS